MDSVFDSIFENKVNYPVDIKENDKELELDIAVVGLDKKDIKIEIKNGDILSISYNKKKELQGSETEKNNYIYNGITHKSFNMAWKISNKFDLTKIEAKLEKGLLKFLVPVSPNSEPKFIEIKD